MYVVVNSAFTPMPIKLWYACTLYIVALLKFHTLVSTQLGVLIHVYTHTSEYLSTATGIVPNFKKNMYAILRLTFPWISPTLDLAFDRKFFEVQGLFY